MGDEDTFFTAVDSQSEANTQKIESQNNTPLEDTDDSDDPSWGVLQPTANFNFEPLALKNDIYTCGRSANCDIIIKEDKLNNNLPIDVISKIQFRIIKEKLSSNIEVIHLEDMSMNGTFVNKSKVGKGKKVLLNSGDEIAITNSHNKVYLFYFPCDKNWIPHEMKQIYSVTVALGSGAYGEVRLAQNKDSKKLVAIKKVKKREGKDEKKMFNEVKILQSLKHPCIVSMENVFDTSESLFIVLEFISGGELASRIREVTKMSDGEAKAIFYQLVLALQYLHRKGVAHRDLKPENVLLRIMGSGGERLVKVTDFGLSKLATSKSDLKTICGTPLYTAPEILMTRGTGCYTHLVDIWSLAVILFQCLSGKLPFHRARRTLPVIDQIVRASYSMAGREWCGVSSNATSLIRKMLQADPNQRITIDQILAHPWLQDKEMKTKVNSLMNKTAPCGDENLCLETVRPNKRPRLEDSDDDTIFRS